MVGVSALSATALVQMVGNEYGIYQRHGFDVEVQQVKPNGALIALLSNELAFSRGVDSAIRGNATDNLPIKIVAVNERAPTFGLVAGPEVGRVQDLRGKMVGVTAASGASLSALKRVLEAKDLALQDA